MLIFLMRIPKGGIFCYLAAIECYKFIMHYAESAGLIVDSF
jgi:hypothetical protein